MTNVVIFRFCFTVGLLGVWLSLQSHGLMDGKFAMAMAGAASVTGLLAVIFGEPFRGPTLNRWDETLGYLGVAALGHALSTV